MLAELKENLRSSILDENPVLIFGGLLIRMGEYEKAEYFYQIGLTMENQSARLATIWNQLGFIFGHLDRIDEARTCYQKSLRAKQQYLDKNDPQLATAYNNMGSVYQRQGNLELALEYFRHALSIHLLTPESNQEYIATEYNNIAAILIEQGNLEEAVVC
jgi:tetratricopeptide (TPR) repeat protein